MSDEELNNNKPMVTNSLNKTDLIEIKNPIVTIWLLEKNEFQKILNSIEKQKKNNDKVLYVSFTRSYIRLINHSLLNNHIHKYFTVDYVSKYIMPEIKDKSSVIYRIPPDTLEQFQDFLNNIQSTVHANIIVIDSLNQLFSITKAPHESIAQLFNFLDNINDQIDENSVTAIVLFYNKDNMHSDYLEDIIKNNINIDIEENEKK